MSTQARNVEPSNGQAAQTHSEKYRAHLQSQQWRSKRMLVLQRCRFVCEGCGEEPAVEVHHRTYANVFSEFLFELVALCRECHARVHGLAVVSDDSVDVPLLQHEPSDGDLREIVERARARRGLPVST